MRGIGISRTIGPALAITAAFAALAGGPVRGYYVEERIPSRAKRKARENWTPTKAPAFKPTGSKRSRRRRNG